MIRETGPDSPVHKTEQMYLPAALALETPALFYVARQIAHNCAVYETVTDHPKELRYAVKACATAPVLKAIATRGWGADCQSMMEVDLAVKAGVPPNLISLCSPRLSPHDTAQALSQGVLLIADSPHQLEIIAEAIACVRPPEGWHIGARLSLSIEGTERFHRKLGMTLEQLVETLNRLPILSSKLTEVHHHGLAREHDHSKPSAIARHLADAVQAIESTTGIAVERINFGGGLEPESILQTRHGTNTKELVASMVGSLPPEILTGRILVLEPGRAITKDAAFASTSVANLKELRGTRVAVVDVSTNLLIPLPLAEFEVAPGTTKTESELLTWDIVDGTCSPAGVIAKGSRLPALNVGDKLLIKYAGAYTCSLAEPFYDLLPEMYWINEDNQLSKFFNRTSAQRWMESVWGFR